MGPLAGHPGWLPRQTNPTFISGPGPPMSKGPCQHLVSSQARFAIKVLPGDKIYQAMEIEPGFMRPAILHGFGTRAKQRLPSRLEELAQFGWLPLAAALFGTAEWQPQWLHHNFLPVIGLRVHAKIPSVPAVVSAASGVTGIVGTKTCHWKLRAGPLPRLLYSHLASQTAFSRTRGVDNSSERRSFRSRAVFPSGSIRVRQPARHKLRISLVDRPKKWAQWLFSMNSLWQEDSPMPDRPLTVHCSGLGGGLLSPDHDYDLFFQNHAQMKVYGPSLAMTDDWEQRITQLGLTKTTHEYANLSAFSPLPWDGVHGRYFFAG